MRKLGIGLAIGVLLATLTGCGAGTRADEATSLCVEEAKQELAVSSIDSSALEAMNLEEALFDAEITDSKDADDSNSLYVVSGDITWTADDKVNRKTMVCQVTFENGTAGDPNLMLSS